MGVDLIEQFRGVVRAALGLPKDPGEPPDLMRLGLYRATVVKTNSDGSKLDLQPEDSRIAPEKNVPVRVGIPGAIAVVQTGAVVLMGWERGDPARPYCAPNWEGGATVTKLVINAANVFLGDEGGAKALATKEDVDAHVHTFTYNAGTVTGATATTDVTTPITGTQKTKAA